MILSTLQQARIVLENSEISNTKKHSWLKQIESQMKSIESCDKNFILHLK